MLTNDPIRIFHTPITATNRMNREFFDHKQCEHLKYNLRLERLYGKEKLNIPTFTRANTRHDVQLNESIDVRQLL